MVESKAPERRALFIINERYDLGRAKAKYINLPYIERQEIVEVFEKRMNFQTKVLIDQPVNIIKQEFESFILESAIKNKITNDIPVYAIVYSGHGRLFYDYNVGVDYNNDDIPLEEFVLGTKVYSNIFGFFDFCHDKKEIKESLIKEKKENTDS